PDRYVINICENRGNPPAVRAEDHARLAPNRQGKRLLPGPWVPDTDDTLDIVGLGSGCQPLAIRAKCNPIDAVRKSAKLQKFLSGSRIPDPGREVATSGSQAGAIGAEGETVNLLGVSAEGKELLAGVALQPRRV